MQQGTVVRVQGFHDRSGDEYRKVHGAAESLTSSFRLHGFQLMDVPLVEGLDLYLRKNGAQVLSRLYSFIDPDRREVALRPEFTASVIRALAAEVGASTIPARVAYAGPVFRNEQGQREEPRHFTQAGIELLGDGSAVADADVLALACRAALDAGLPGVRLVLGHLGPLRTLLTHLKVNGHAEGYLLEHLERRYRGGTGVETVRRRLGLQARTSEGAIDTEALPEHLADAVRGAGPGEARALVRTMLDQMGLSLEGSTRTPDEIIDRVLLKARRHASLRGGAGREELERALAFTEQLSLLRGDPAEVIPRAEKLLSEYQVPPEALDELREVLDLLRLHDLGGVTIELAPGMARGIAYYSGLIFELYADQAIVTGQEAQICGGGRYDALALAITGSHGFPALGFSFNVESLASVLPYATAPSGRRIGLMVLAPRRRRLAYRVADSLRSSGFAVTIHEPAIAPELEARRLRENGYAAMMTFHLSPDFPEIVVFEEPLGNDRLTALLARIGEDSLLALERPTVLASGEERA
ncbi:MAG TPA: ATP phosphoribosyltransferase regulatory subunit [Chloroflexota bacterium]|nr:ATP phosphoribosyltransferase regulatory subunit [Chloroflexota bacterium]